MNIAKFNLEDLIRENVARLKPYSSARDEFKELGQQMIFLDANENPFNTAVNRYPDPQQRNLKEILAQQKDVSVQNILLGNGSDEVLDLIFRAFCEPGKDNIISLPPTYGMYGVLADTNNIENKEVVLKANFQLDIAPILNAVNAKTKIIFLCSPNNPTGNSFADSEVLSLLNSFNGLIVIDEAYIDFSKQHSWLQQLQNYPNLIITQTLSKAYGMAGIRLGICYASVEIIRVLNKIKPPYNVNVLTQERAVARVIDSEAVAKEIAIIKQEREQLQNKLKAIAFVEEVYESDANFVLVKVDDADMRYSQLLMEGVVVRNRTNQALCKNSLRFTVGTPTENEQLVKALKKIQ
jgi:histidinol-phosphate aminotransferase